MKLSGALKRRRARVLKCAHAAARVRRAAVKGPERAALVDLDLIDQREAYDDAAIADEYARHISDLVPDRNAKVRTVAKRIEILFRDAAGSL